ncbi:hypothetical protein SA27298_1846 [Streptococcus anginosus]|nr:hypothetical protein SA27298_1846 [Streptococcus anginosus]
MILFYHKKSEKLHFKKRICKQIDKTKNFSKRKSLELPAF